MSPEAAPAGRWAQGPGPRTVPGAETCSALASLHMCVAGVTCVCHLCVSRTRLASCATHQVGIVRGHAVCAVWPECVLCCVRLFTRGVRGCVRCVCSGRLMHTRLGKQLRDSGGHLQSLLARQLGWRGILLHRTQLGGGSPLDETAPGLGERPAPAHRTPRAPYSIKGQRYYLPVTRTTVTCILAATERECRRKAMLRGPLRVDGDTAAPAGWVQVEAAYTTSGGSFLGFPWSPGHRDWQ